MVGAADALKVVRGLPRDRFSVDIDRQFGIGGEPGLLPSSDKSLLIGICKRDGGVEGGIEEEANVQYLHHPPLHRFYFSADFVGSR